MKQAVKHCGGQHGIAAERAIPTAKGRPASAKALDERVKLASGERRILTVLARYPEGRSKVQVAILSGYAPNGGGFNNYLGALRTRGLIEGNGERRAITEAVAFAMVRKT